MIEIYKAGRISQQPSRYEGAFIINNKMLDLQENRTATEASVYPTYDREVKIEWILD